MIPSPDIWSGWRKQSLVSFDVPVSKEDKIITLSTCTGNDATRFIVQARREGEY